MRQQLTRATVEVLAGSAKGTVVEVLFNPTEYSVEHSASFGQTAPPGLDNPITQFVNGNAQVLTTSTATSMRRRPSGSRGACSSSTPSSRR